MGDEFFISDEQTKKENEEVKKQLSRKKSPPKSYLPVKLSSMGRLSVPAKIHVRNYNGSDAEQLSLASEENILETILDVLSNMIWEDIDPLVLHEKELEEIMFNLFINFWSSSVEKVYPYTDEELEGLTEKRAEDIKKGNEIPTVLIPYDSVDTIPINENFKEPITILPKNGAVERTKKVSFILPRIGHIVDAKHIVEEKYYEQEERFTPVKRALEKGEEVDDREYTKYLRERMQYFNLLTQCQMISKIDGKKLETIEDKINAYHDIDLDYWSTFDKTVRENANFGIQEEMKVKSPLTGEYVTRRLRFRLMDFLPTMDTQSVSEYDIVFGE